MKTRLMNMNTGRGSVTDYVPARPTYTAPVIMESYVDDKGDIQHILASGNTLSENNYVKHWGQPKGKINLNAKDKSIDGRSNWIK